MAAAREGTERAATAPALPAPHTRKRRRTGQPGPPITGTAAPPPAGWHEVQPAPAGAVAVVELGAERRGEVGRLLAGGLAVPTVFKGDLLSDWPARHWTPASLAASEELGRVKTSFATFERGRPDQIVWETRCGRVDATLGELARWMHEGTGARRAEQGGSRAEPESAATLPDAATHWGYASYQRVHELFADTPQAYGSMDWAGALGVPGEPRDSNFWFGSAGATTQCHQDSYGTNLVLQVCGAKTWTLFPPDASPLLYPTRVPYEESSVFSRVNLASPDLARTPLYAHARPRAQAVTLQPGDLLFVPRHWWHHVTADSNNISLNLWMPAPEDAAERVREALVLALVALGRAGAGPGETEVPLNPGQEAPGVDNALAVLRDAMAATAATGGAGAYDTPLTLARLIDQFAHPSVIALVHELLTAGQ